MVFCSLLWSRVSFNGLAQPIYGLVWPFYGLLWHNIDLIGLVFFSLDADQPGPFSTVEYYVADGPFSDYVAFENPLEGNLVLTKSLDYETMRSLSLSIEAKDQGAPPMSTQSLLTINVIDADDQNPAFLYERYDALLPAKQETTRGSLFIE